MSVPTLMLVALVMIWLIGTLFTLGIEIAIHIEEDESFNLLKEIVICITVWPFIMALILMAFLFTHKENS